MYLDDVISFGTDAAPEALTRLTEVLERLSSFGLQLNANKCIFYADGGGFLGPYRGIRAGVLGSDVLG